MNTIEQVYKKISIAQQFSCERVDPRLREILNRQTVLIGSLYAKRDEGALKRMWAELLLLVMEMNSQEQIELGARLNAEGLVLELKRVDQRALKIIERKKVRNREEYEILKSFFERCVLGHSTDSGYIRNIDHLLMDYKESE